MATTFNYLASQLVSAREAFPSKSYKSLGLLPQLRRQAVGPDSQGDAAEGLALGNPERIVRAMKNWESVGVDRVNFLLNCMEEIPQEQVLKSLRLFAGEVMPHFQQYAVPAATPVGSAAQ
jgi:alkanesulfonate monooxygenase SsuD/methylene tetrahydromethanopterin reductase-like flavin-dependent oxidoreductase (luciferase family)